MSYLKINSIILFLFIIIIIVVPHEKMTNLEKILIDINLDSGWAADYNVECSTGKGVHNKSTKVKTSHCSCLIYYVCKKMGLYIPSPPEYSQFHLANKQIDWLSSNEASEEGWIEINKSIPKNYIYAQKQANKGYLVIAGVSQDDKVNGHIAIVRPYRNVDYNLISKRGPIVMASSSPNTYADYLDEEFRLTRKEYKHLDGRVKFFYNSKTN
jgi:hypothetical protein